MDSFNDNSNENDLNKKLVSDYSIDRISMNNSSRSNIKV